MIMQLNQSHIASTNNDFILMSNVSVSPPPYFIMVTIRAFGFFMPFTLPLGDQGHVNVFEDLLA